MEQEYVCLNCGKVFYHDPVGKDYCCEECEDEHLVSVSIEMQDYQEDMLLVM